MTGRDRIVVMVVAAVALLGAFYFLAVSPKRAEVKAVDIKVAAAQKRLAAANASVVDAQQAKRDYDDDYAAVARLGKAVPLDDNMPSLIYQLQSASRNAKVDFRSLKLSESGSAPAAPVAPAATAAAGTASGSGAAAGSGSSSSSSAPSSTAPPPTTPSSTPAAGAAAPVPATQLAAAALPPGASVGAAGFPTMPFAFIFDGSFFDMEHMLRDVNRFITVKGKSVSVRGRLLSIDGFSLEAAPSGFPKVTATLAATAYLLPTDQGLTAGATAAAPAAAGTAPAATTASSGSTPAPPTAAATGVK